MVALPPHHRVLSGNIRTRCCTTTSNQRVEKVSVFPWVKWKPFKIISLWRKCLDCFFSPHSMLLLQLFVEMYRRKTTSMGYSRSTHGVGSGRCWWLSPLWSPSDLGFWHISGVWTKASLLRGSSKRSPRHRGSPWLWSAWCWWRAGCAPWCHWAWWPECSGSWRLVAQADGPQALQSGGRYDPRVSSRNTNKTIVKVGGRVSPAAVCWHVPFLALHERLSGWDK